LVHGLVIQGSIHELQNPNPNPEVLTSYTEDQALNHCSQRLVNIIYVLYRIMNIFLKFGTCLFGNIKFQSMKILKWLSYFFGVLGVLLILTGIGTVITNKHNLQYVYTASYFLAGNSFLLITIALYLFIHQDQHKKDSSHSNPL
jgi:hypothetical protein